MLYGSIGCSEEPPAEGIDVERRILSTGEALLWKIFPGGFGWQAAALFASKWFDLPRTSICFALMTGAGNFSGVLLGHTTLGIVKQTWFDATVSTNREMHIAIFLACSAFLSGLAWQPAVNCLHGIGLGISAVAVGASIICGLMFLGGLRLGRILYNRWELRVNVRPFWDSPHYIPVVEHPTPDNLFFDMQLAGSIAGAAACFICTDATFGSSNWLLPILGVEASTSPFLGCIKAGCSSFLGFAVVQLVQNAILPRGGCWTDAERPIDIRYFAKDFVNKCRMEGVLWWL